MFIVGGGCQLLVLLVQEGLSVDCVARHDLVWLGLVDVDPVILVNR